MGISNRTILDKQAALISGTTTEKATMKRLLKNGARLAVCFICLLSFGCSTDPNQLDGRHVKDAEGVIYKVRANYGDAYFLTELKEDKTNDLERLKER